MTINPICDVLTQALDAGLEKLNKAVAFQKMIKTQADNIIALTDLSTALDAIPTINPNLTPAELNAIIASCPGQFPDIPSINSFLSKGLKDYLNSLRGSPLGSLSSMINSLNEYMKPMNDSINSLYNYLTCMRNICGFVQGFDSKWTSITNAKTLLNLDSSGNPQILSSTTKNIVSSYDGKVNSMKAAIKTLST